MKIIEIFGNKLNKHGNEKQIPEYLTNMTKFKLKHFATYTYFYVKSAVYVEFVSVINDIGEEQNLMSHVTGHVHIFSFKEFHKKVAERD